MSVQSVRIIDDRLKYRIKISKNIILSGLSLSVKLIHIQNI